MATGTMVSVEEYLKTSYSPDCDYVDGRLVERNVGEWDRSRLQAALTSYFYTREKQSGLLVATEQRVQVTASRFRVPDVCLVNAPTAGHQILYSPPFLCIEILSKDDRVVAMQEKIDDYLNFGVKCVWVIDPQTRKAHIYHPTGIAEAKDGVLVTHDPDIRISLHEI